LSIACPVVWLASASCLNDVHRTAARNQVSGNHAEGMPAARVLKVLGELRVKVCEANHETL
jgi:hypothetical protein